MYSSTGLAYWIAFWGVLEVRVLRENDENTAMLYLAQ